MEWIYSQWLLVPTASTEREDVDCGTWGGVLLILFRSMTVGHTRVPLRESVSVGRIYPERKSPQWMPCTSSSVVEGSNDLNIGNRAVADYENERMRTCVAVGACQPLQKAFTRGLVGVTRGRENCVMTPRTLADVLANEE